MTLDEYIRASPRGEAARLARSLQVHPVMVSQWAANKKALAPARAPQVEQATNGAVRRWDMRPLDWYVIWPELIGAAGAPPVPAVQAVEERNSA